MNDDRKFKTKPRDALAFTSASEPIQKISFQTNTYFFDIVEAQKQVNLAFNSLDGTPKGESCARNIVASMIMTAYYRGCEDTKYNVY